MQCVLVSPVFGMVSSLHPTSFLMIFILVELVFSALPRVCTVHGSRRGLFIRGHTIKGSRGSLLYFRGYFVMDLATAFSLGSSFYG